MPWRERPTPYRVWISEVMLQQTRVATVIPYFERFVEAFASPAELASAPEQEVLTLWAGLGYYRRARHLHRAARQVVARHGGELPDDLKELRRLAGVGEYTAAAIASIAFGLPAPVIDGNVKRVLSRVLALDEPVDGPAGRRRLASFAAELLDRGDPSSHNQALMELGALVCKPRRPACDECPIITQCRAAALGAPEGFPRKLRAKRPPTPAHAVCGILRRPPDGAVLLARRPHGGLLGGLWEAPGGPLPEDRSPVESLREAWAERLGVSARVGLRRATVVHVFTHLRLALEVFDVEAISGQPRPSFYTDVSWRSPERLDDLPVSRLTRKVFAAVSSRG